MLIDWFTVGAQLVNFLILVWLLKRFLYRPVLRAIDAREKRIAAELAEADAKKADALKERDDFQAKNKAFNEQRAALLDKAVEDANAENERLLGVARTLADELRAKEDSSLHAERARLGGRLSRLAALEVVEIARRTLGDLATVSLEERIGEVFTRRLRELDAKSRETLATALRNSSDHAVISSRFDLGSTQRAAIQNALNEDFSADIHLRFETTPEGICGVELTVGGQRVAWDIADYLSSLDRKVGQFLDTQAPTAVPAPATPAPEARAALFTA
jgi:F-type H+-transporting ATPase subunit b